jgi:hypothetical protein
MKFVGQLLKALIVTFVAVVPSLPLSSSAFPMNAGLIGLLVKSDYFCYPLQSANFQFGFLLKLPVGFVEFNLRIQGS